MYFLVTGCYRSGTTLLDKLLHGHRELVVASQPYPALYFHVKAAFDAAIGSARRYPLYHLFRESAYGPDELRAFLDEHRFDSADVAAIFAALEAYRDGVWTPELLSVRDTIAPGRFLDLFGQLHDRIAESLATPGDGTIAAIGSKEIMVEELAPHLIAGGVKVIVIIRDPRDVVASASFRQRAGHTGDDRPVLFSVRAWRKSVALAAAHQDHDNLHWLRYEDLVSRPAATLAEIGEFLGVSAFPQDDPGAGLTDQRGRPWHGNSSFAEQRGISKSSVGRFRDRLPESVTAYIETTCLPEMRLLDYRPAVIDGFDARWLRDYRVPFATVHGKFPRDYSTSADRIADEIERYRRLTGERAAGDAEEIRRWFIDPRAYRRLRRLDV